MKYLLILVVLFAGCCPPAVTAISPDGDVVWTGDQIDIYTPDGFVFVVDAH